jgi:hypothetical protein
MWTQDTVQGRGLVNKKPRRGESVKCSAFEKLSEHQLLKIFIKGVSV